MKLQIQSLEDVIVGASAYMHDSKQSQNKEALPEEVLLEPLAQILVGLFLQGKTRGVEWGELQVQVQIPILLQGSHWNEKAMA